MPILYISYPSFIRPEIVPSLPVRWYSVMYLVALFISFVLFNRVSRRENFIDREESENLAVATFMGLLVFAHIFSCLFYSDWRYYLTHPLQMFWPFDGGRFVGLPGMSFHGGLFGAVLGSFLYCRYKRIDFLWFADIACSVIPFGYTFGRLGNFINAELYGRVTTGPLGMVFPEARPFSTELEWVRDVCEKIGMEMVPGSYVNLPRHPSQLYEALFEGLVAGCILYFVLRPYFSRHHFGRGSTFASYFIIYGTVRFLIEYCRQPDSDIGYVIALGKNSDNIALFQSFLNISKGQVFCALMVLIGIVMLLLFNRRRERDAR